MMCRAHSPAKLGHLAQGLRDWHAVAHGTSCCAPERKNSALFVCHVFFFPSINALSLSALLSQSRQLGGF